MKKKLLILVDGSSYLHRAYHALPPLVSSKGMPTGAIYGVVNMIKKTLSDHKPDYIGVIFDAKGKNFRHELYPEYKATRPPMDDDLKVQIKPLNEVIAALGLPLLIIDEVEADDVIGTLTKEALKHKDVDVLISTGDKDMAQLVDENVTLVNTMSNTTLDAAGVKNKFGIWPKQIVDYLTLVGDSSDNISGITGVGPKTAVKWLEEHENLDKIVANKDQIKGKVGENLKKDVERLPLIKKLVTIKDDVKLDVSLNDLAPKKANTDKLAELYARLEFKSWLKGLDGDQKTSAKSTGKYHLILTEKDFEQWLEKLQKAEEFAFDLETTSLDVISAEIVGISFAVKIGEAIYIPFTHVGVPGQLKREDILKKLKPVFEDKSKVKLAQNIKYDISVLANHDIEVRGECFDTMIESYVLNSAHNQHDKYSLVLRHLGRTITTYEDLVGKGAKQIPFNELSLEDALPYAALDSDLVLELHDVLWPQIKKNKGEEKVFKEIEMPLVKVLSRMERKGVAIDEKFLNRYSMELEKRLEELQHQIYKESGSEFNINSPAQLREILYEKLELPVLQKTPKGQASTAESVLQELALEYELPELILEYRSLSKLKSTYTDALPEDVNQKTGRIHTSYNQAITTTGRLSSTNPNLQNIPIRTEEGRRVRKAFVAPKDHKIISADYSQIELRIMAHLSGDESLQEAFKKGADIHRMVASEIFGVRSEKVTDNQRRDAKTINFGLIYGMSAFGLAKRIGMSNNDAKKYIEIYFARYPKMKDYMEKMKESAHAKGYVESIFGRRVYVPEIKSKNFMRKQAAERVAVNAPIQGSAADIIKLAMIDIDKWQRKCDFNIAMIMQVHDELVFEVDAKYVKSAEQEIKKRMEEVIKLDVPILVEIGVGDNWDEAH